MLMLGRGAKGCLGELCRLKADGKIMTMRMNGLCTYSFLFVLKVILCDDGWRLSQDSLSPLTLKS